MQYLILDWVLYRRDKNALKKDIIELLTKLEYDGILNKVLYKS